MMNDSGGDASATRPATRRLLTVKQVVRETPDAVSLVLSDQTGARVEFTPGQFFLVSVNINGEVLRRTYSASAAPGEYGGGLRLTVKRVPEGRVSTRIVTEFREGDVLEVAGPMGRFVPSTCSGPRHLVFIAGGNGITPLMSMIRTLLVTEPCTRLSLLYGNRRLLDVIFLKELEAMVAGHADRLFVRHILTDPEPGWTGGVGRVVDEVLLEQLRAVGPCDEYYVCGPAPMMEAVLQTLVASGVMPERIRTETFGKAPGTT